MERVQDSCTYQRHYTDITDKDQSATIVFTNLQLPEANNGEDIYAFRTSEG